MTLFSFHLAPSSFFTTTDALLDPPSARTVAGLRHAECMTCMQLGSSIVSPARMQLGSLAMFARWESEAALASFLVSSALGETLRAGWHVRLELLRRWGHVTGLQDLPEVAGTVDDDAPVVAVTIARMKLLEVPRFIRWGRPATDATSTTNSRRCAFERGASTARGKAAAASSRLQQSDEARHAADFEHRSRGARRGPGGPPVRLTSC